MNMAPLGSSLSGSVKPFVFTIMRHDYAASHSNQASGQTAPRPGMFGSVTSTFDKDILNKLYGDRMPPAANKRPVIAMNYIEVNTIKMKLDYIKAMVRCNAKRLEELFKL
jgi:hypothetical protein